MPPNKAFRCAYVARQVGVKYTYGLWVTEAEQNAMVAVLTTCPTEPLPTGSKVPEAPAAPVVVPEPAPVVTTPAPAPAPVVPAPVPTPARPPARPPSPAPSPAPQPGPPARTELLLGPTGQEGFDVGRLPVSA